MQFFLANYRKKHQSKIYLTTKNFKKAHDFMQNISQAKPNITDSALDSFAKDTTLILLAAGESTRLRERFPIKKQWLSIDDKPLWLFLTQKCVECFSFAQVLVSAHKDEQNYMRKLCEYEITQGGESRQDSITSALEKVQTKWVLISDVARFGIDYDIISRLFGEAITLNEQGECIDCVVPTLRVPDTAIYDGKYIKRESLLRIQTPQLSGTQSLRAALQGANQTYTDESSIITANGGKVAYIEGKDSLRKLTFAEDLEYLADFASSVQANHTAYKNDTFIGNGIDVHSFEEGKQMVLGGVKIDSSFGFRAHSDGDVVLHSLIDALLGAIGAGDIGEWFPDNDESYKNADSKQLLKSVVSFLQKVGFVVGNVDISIIAQMPKITPYKRAIQESIAALLGVPLRFVNIKATTTEHLGFVGRGEGVCVMTSAIVRRVDWVALAKSYKLNQT